jgi:hypothetical protein
MRISRLALVVAFAVAAGVTIGAADWPQWQGPDRTGI